MCPVDEYCRFKRDISRGMFVNRQERQDQRWIKVEGNPKAPFSLASTSTYDMCRNSRQGWAPLLTHCMHNLSSAILATGTHFIYPPRMNGKLSELWSAQAGIRTWRAGMQSVSVTHYATHAPSCLLMDATIIT